MRLASIISRIEKHKRKAKELGKSDLSNDVVFSALAMEYILLYLNIDDFSNYVFEF